MTADDRASPDHLLAEAAFAHRLARALLRDRELALDVAQEALLATVRRAPDGEVRDRRGWLQSVLRRLAGRAVREQRRRGEREQRARRPEADDHEHQTAERLQLHRRLCDAVLALPEPYRTAVSMRFLDDLSPRAIGRRLGIDAAVVRQRVYRGLQLLRERFDAQPGGRGAWTHAFAVGGLGGPPAVLSLLLPVLLMKKVVAVAVLLVSLGVWWLLTSPTGNDAVVPPASGAPVVASAANGKDPAVVAQQDEAAASTRQRVAVEFTVRVVDTDAHALAGATVHCWRDGEDVREAVTKDDGRAEFAPADASGGVLVRRAGFRPVLQTVATLRGESMVVLGRGSKVAGQMLEDGAPAPAGIVLRLSVSPPVLPAGAPFALRRLVEEGELGAEASTDKHGRFTFAGLDPSWSGGLLLPRTHWLLPQAGQVAQDDSRLLLVAPQVDLLVATTRLPTVQGRVLWADTDEPAGGTTVLISKGTLTDGAKLPALGIRADADGRFALGLFPSSPADHDRWIDRDRRSPVAFLVVSSTNGDQSRVTLDGSSAPIDLGREVLLRVARTPRPWFRAVDPDGRPLAGACGENDDGSIGEPTGTDGLGTVRNRFALSVGAPDRQVVHQRLDPTKPHPRDDPLVVTLPKRNAMRVRVHGDGAAAVGSLRVSLVGAGGIFGGLAGRPGNLHRHFGAAASDLMGRSFAVDAHGEALLHSLQPGVACRLAATDALGSELATAEVTTPALGDELVVDLQVHSVAHRVRGHVVDADAVPVPLASLELRRGKAGGSTIQTRSAADGTFAFAAVHTNQELTVAARRPGFAATERALPPDEVDQELTVVLAPARRTTLRIVDDAGAAVPEIRPEVATGSSERANLQKLGPGEYLCLDLPPGEVTFAGYVGGQRFELRHDTGKPTAELRVPRPARARIIAPTNWPAATSGRHVAVATRLDTTAEPIPVELDKEGADAVLFLPGRYRIALAVLQWNAEKQQREFAEQGPAAEVDLRAGTTTRVPLQ